MTEVPAAFVLVISLVILGSAASWLTALTKLFSRQSLLVFEPRRSPRWSLLEIFITVMIMFTLQGLTVAVIDGAFPPDDLAPAITADSHEVPSKDLDRASRIIVLSGVASLIACGLGGLLIAIRTGSSWGEDLGLTLRQARRDVSYGIVAYLMLAPIIGAIQALMQHWYPSEHPLIQDFRENPTLEFYAVCVFSAAIVAPPVEEFLCRVLLQGWLERVFDSKSIKHALLPETIPEMAVLTPDAPQSEVNTVTEMEAPIDGTPNQSPRGRPSGMPIIISSLLFALMHWGHGPDPIPLFVLALGLGYLYQRTHRILPCVVLHFLVNAFSLAALSLSLAKG